MKKLLFPALLILFSSITFSQKYVPFPTENAEWHVKYQHESEYTPLKTLLILNYHISGDTIINSKTYKKVYGGSEINKIKGGIREENKRIYYLDFTNSSSYLSMVKQQSTVLKNCIKQKISSIKGDFLLYDFNKTKIGDTLFVFPWGNEPATITNIDSVKVQNSYRKRYEYNATWHGKDYVIEGIGSVKQGLFGAITDIPMCGYFDWEFVCFSQNGESVYKNPAYVDCNSTEKWSDKDYLKTGTQWYYGEIDYNGGILSDPITIDNYNSIKSTGDTIINGIKCNTLRQVKGNAGCAAYEDIVYVYQSNDTVYLLNSMTKKFSPLYIYGANKGDSWRVSYSSQKVIVNIDSVSSVQALGRSLKVQYVTYILEGAENSYKYGQRSTIIENIGDPNYFFMSNIVKVYICDEFYVTRKGLRCYVHPDYGTYHVPGALDCSYVTAVKDVNTYPVKVYINASDKLKIESELLSDPCTVELMDLRGIVVLRATVDAARNSLPLGNLNNGMYIYRLSRDGKLLKTDKLVKM